MSSQTFDVLVIGGGITGAGVARDAASRGLSVALVEKRDFAWGTSSRSSKLIHGGLRYLENWELSLVFEALSERALLLRTAPHMVRPLPFFLPVYEGDAHGKGLLNLGLWLYDLLALFRAPGFHRSLSRKQVLAQLPFLKKEGLTGGLKYFDASMWDDALAVETLRAAQDGGVAVANYTEAIEPLWQGDRVTGYRVRDAESGRDFEVHAQKVVICAGPWTDQVGAKLSPDWKRWLGPSKGVHLIFDHKKIPVPGAVVMSHPQDGRISFVIPRPDFGAGVTIVGTTDAPIGADPEKVSIEPNDVSYLMELLQRYFPELKLSPHDVLSGYVGVRPLMAQPSHAAENGSEPSGIALQKVSREHHIGSGPGGTVLVAGGKYTTYRRMAQEIVDFTLMDAAPELRQRATRSKTRGPVNPQGTVNAVRIAQIKARNEGVVVPRELFERYGADALEILKIAASAPAQQADPDGFPCLEAQLRFSMRSGMVMHLEDFYFRRMPLYSCRADHGVPWCERLAQIWAEERGLDAAAAGLERQRLMDEISRRSAWKQSLEVTTQTGTAVKA